MSSQGIAVAQMWLMVGKIERGERLNQVSIGCRSKYLPDHAYREGLIAESYGVEAEHRVILSPGGEAEKTCQGVARPPSSKGTESRSCHRGTVKTLVRLERGCALRILPSCFRIILFPREASWWP